MGKDRLPVVEVEFAKVVVAEDKESGLSKCVYDKVHVFHGKVPCAKYCVYV